MKEDLIIRQLNIITKWMDAVNEKAKSIHELSDIDNTSTDLYVAVSDGQNTGKILFPLNTITDDEIQRLLKLTLETDPNYSSIILRDGDSTILSSLDIAKIIEENQKNLEGQYIDDRLSGLASDLQENEQKEIRTKLGIDLENILLKIQDLENTAKPKDYYSDSFMITAGDISDGRVQKTLTYLPIDGSLFVFVRGVFIDEDAYEVNGKTITIFGSRIDYGIKEGDLISARYEYLTTE